MYGLLVHGYLRCVRGNKTENQEIFIINRIFKEKILFYKKK